MPVICPTTLLVAGSMILTISAALFVWMIRTFPVFAVVLCVCPRTHAASVCHSGSSCDNQCFPPSWLGSPPADSANGCVRSLLAVGLLDLTLARMTSKFLRDSSSVHVAAPGDRGCKRMGVPDEWQETQRACPSRFAKRIGCTFALKYSKSRDVEAGGA